MSLLELLHDQRTTDPAFSIYRATVWCEPAPEDQHRAHLWANQLREARHHDFAILWDEDFDERIVRVAERLAVKGLLSNILFIGERRARVYVVTVAPPSEAYIRLLSDLLKDQPDPWHIYEAVPARNLDDDAASHVLRSVYDVLSAIRIMWRLGSKPIEVEVESPILTRSRNTVRGTINDLKTRWLPEIQRWAGRQGSVKIKQDYEKIEGEKKLCFDLFTARHRYRITAIERDQDAGYLGAMVETLTPRPGEDHVRGNDLHDGELTYRDWQAILTDIVAYEMTSPPLQKIKGVTGYEPLYPIETAKLSFICDTCHRNIVDVDDGWVEWIVPPGSGGARGFRLCHHPDVGDDCSRYSEAPGRRDGHLQDFLGRDGLVRFLEIMRDGVDDTASLSEVMYRLFVDTGALKKIGADHD